MDKRDNALSWIQGLQARGVTLVAKGKQLRFYPGSAYSNLTDDESLVLRHNKQAIMDAVRASPAPVAQVAQVAVTPTKPQTVCEHCHGKPYVGPKHCATEVGCPYCHQNCAGPPEPSCSYCGGQPCVGPYHPAFSTLHALDPVESAKRDKAATAAMYHMLPFGTY